MTEYNKELQYYVLGFNEDECYEPCTEKLDVGVRQNDDILKYACDYMRLFSKNNSSPYISMMAFKLHEMIYDLYFAVYHEEPEYLDLCTMCIVFLSERTTYVTPSNIALDNSKKLYICDDSAEGFLNDLKFLEYKFNNALYEKIDFRDYFVFAGEKYGVKVSEVN